MHQLSIDHDTKSVSISDHPDFDDAHHALMQYVIGADYYLRPVQNAPTHTSYELLRLADDDDSVRAPTPASPASLSSRSSPTPNRRCRPLTTPPATRSAGSTTTTARGDTDRKATPATATP